MELRVEGALAPYLEVELSNDDVLMAEPGSLLAKDPGVSMKAHLEGGLGAALKRALTGSSVFLVEYRGPGQVTLSKGAPGRLLPLSLDGDRSVLVERGAFLCAERGVHLDATSPSDLSGIFWGQLPLLMLKLEGAGRAYAFARGDVKELHLGVGESVDVMPGRIVWLEHGVRVTKGSSLGLKDALLAGVGLSLACLTGPGRVCLQTVDAVLEHGGGRGAGADDRWRPRRRQPGFDDDRVPERWIWDRHRGD